MFKELDGIILSDNCMDVVPNDEVFIEANGGDEIKASGYQYLGSTRNETQTVD